jgi:protein phosphatase
MSEMSGIDPRLIATASLSDIGLVRGTNQDFCDIFDNPSGSRLLVVADGMGGHRGGATASRIATETIGELFQAASGEPANILFDAITMANERVHRQSIEDPELRGMGTTVVALLFDTDGLVWVAHVGDSRAYRLHAAGMEQITQDHSVVGEMVRRGLITSEEAEVHPRRNEILRSVGVEPQVEIDVAQVLSAPGDFFILCSDGLTGLVSDHEIAQVVKSEAPVNATKQLVAMANEGGGLDNITVQIAMLPDEDSTTLRYDDVPLESSQVTQTQGGQPKIPQAQDTLVQMTPAQVNEPEGSPFKLISWFALAFVGLIAGYFVLSGSGEESETTSPRASSRVQAEGPAASAEDDVR